MAGELGSISGSIVIEYDNKGIAKADQSVKGFTKTAGAEGDKAGKGLRSGFVGALKGMAAAVGGIFAAIQIGKFITGVISDVTDMRNAIITGTGASGEALDGLVGSAKNVAKQVPNSFAEVGAAIADVNTRLGLTGKPLEEITTKFLDLADVTGTDVSSNIKNITRVFGDWGIETEDQSKALDQIFAATQITGVGIDKLTTQVVQFGAPLRQMGFSFEESIAIFSKWEKEGVNAEVVLSGLRQGLSKMAKAGEDPPEALARITEEIKNAGSAGAANALAIEAFGARAGPDMAAAIREGRFEIDELVTALENSDGAIKDADDRTQTFGESWAQFKNNVIAPLVPFILTAMDSITAAMTNKVIPGAQRLFETFKTDVLPVIKELAETWGPRLKTALTELGDFITGVLIPAIVAIAGFFREHETTTKTLAIAIAALIIVTKLHTAAMAVQAAGGIVAFLANYIRSLALVRAAVATATAVQWLWTASMAAGRNALFLLQYGALVASGAISTMVGALGRAVVASTLFVGNMIRMGAVAAATAVRLIAVNAAMLIVRAGILLWTAAQWLLNIALTANPIGLIIVAIAALIAAIIWIATQTTWFQDIWKAVWGVIGGTVTTVFNFIKNLFLTALNFYLAFWTTIWNAVRTVFVGIWNGLVAYVKFVFNLYRTIITTALNIIKTVWTTAWNAVKTVIMTVFNFIQNLISKSIAGWKLIITTALNAIKSTWNSAWNNVKNVVNSVINAIRNIVQSGINRVKSAVAGVSAIISTVRNAFQNAKDAAVGRLNSLLSYVRGIPGRIKSALGNLASRLFSAGQDIIRGLINGIKNMAGRAAQAAKDAVSNALDAAKNLLGIGSPSKVFRDEVGEMIPLGLAQGVKRTSDVPKREVEAMVVRLTAAPRSPAVATQIPAAAVRGGDGATYNFAAGSIVLDASKIKSVRDVVTLVEGLQSTSRQFARKS